MFEEFKLYGTEAVASAERWAREQLLTTGAKVLGADKEAFAVDQVVALYKAATAGIPILNAVEWDDEAVRQLAREAVKWAFEQLRNLLNGIARALPETSVTAPELPVGGVV